jgi:hypothetical protein
VRKCLVALWKLTRNGANILDWRICVATCFSPSCRVLWRLTTGPLLALCCTLGPAMLGVGWERRTGAHASTGWCCSRERDQNFFCGDEMIR